MTKKSEYINYISKNLFSKTYNRTIIDDDYKRGGQGSHVCELEDGTIKQMKEYKYVYDDEYIPIKEIFE